MRQYSKIVFSLVGFLTLAMCTQSAYSQVNSGFIITDFGAKRNNKNVNSQQAIQKAIDACANAGGGKVMVPPGDFYTSTLYLKNNVELNLSSGAALHAIPDMSLYKNNKEGLEDAGDSFIPSLITCKKLKNISITGNGAIIGHPQFYYTEVTYNDTYPGWNENARKYGADMNRPWVKDPKISLIYISECENILINDVDIIDSPNWSCHIQWSKDVNIRGIKILSSLKDGVNSDGLDIDGCKNVIVSDCIIRTGDDAICLKTTNQANRSESCEDITVSNCTLSSSSCAIKIGTESHSDFKRLLFNNCTISNTNRGIGIIIRDGATVSDVTYSNILLDCVRKPVFWWGNGEAIHFNVSKRNKDSKVGIIENVLLHNIKGTVQGCSSLEGFTAASELEKYLSIRSITFSNINLRQDAEAQKDKRAENAITIQNASGISLTDVSIIWNRQNPEKLWKHSLLLADVKGFNLSQLNMVKVAEHSPYPQVVLENTLNGFINTDTNNNKNNIKIAGNNTRNILLKGRSKTTTVLIGAEAKKEVTITD